MRIKFGKKADQWSQLKWDKWNSVLFIRAISIDYNYFLPRFQVHVYKEWNFEGLQELKPIYSIQ